MSRAWRISAAALAVACAIALSVGSADAQSKRKKSVNRADRQTTQQSFGAQAPYVGSRYNMPPGGGINFNDGLSGANYTGGAP